MKDPNPQPVRFAPWETVTLVVRMTSPPVPQWPGGATFQVNVRDSLGNLVLQGTTFSIVDPVVGIVNLTLTSAQTGLMDVGGGDVTPNPPGGNVSGDFEYDVWRTDVGSEKQLAWGPLTARPQQWK